MQRTDPFDGRALTLEDFQEHAASRFADGDELELYWHEQCRPLERRGKRPEREDVFPGKGRGRGAPTGDNDDPGGNAGGGRRHPGADGRGSRHDGAVAAIEELLADDLLSAKRKVKKPAPARKAWPQWPRRILQNQIDSSLEEWLHSIDGRGALCEYHIAIADSYDSTTQILDLYTKIHDSGEKEWMGTEFFEDIGISKIGHRKLFSKWFNDCLTLIDEEPPLEGIAEGEDEGEDEGAEAKLAGSPMPAVAVHDRNGARDRLAPTQEEEDEALRAAEDFLEEWG